jgi:8-oxo-dGTP pyrophosphatase MutT (NUDIX family)
LAAVGSVCAGETYEEAARRELLEEVGITCDLKLLDVHYQEAIESGILMRHFCGIFLGCSDEEPRLNDELSSWKKLSFQQLVDELSSQPDIYCPGLVNDFRFVEKQLSQYILKGKSS